MYLLEWSCTKDRPNSALETSDSFHILWSFRTIHSAHKSIMSRKEWFLSSSRTHMFHPTKPRSFYTEESEQVDTGKKRCRFLGIWGPSQLVKNLKNSLSPLWKGFHLAPAGNKMSPPFNFQTAKGPIPNQASSRPIRVLLSVSCQASQSCWRSCACGLRRVFGPSAQPVGRAREFQCWKFLRKWRLTLIWWRYVESP